MVALGGANHPILGYLFKGMSSPPRRPRDRERRRKQSSGQANALEKKGAVEIHVREERVLRTPSGELFERDLLKSSSQGVALRLRDLPGEGSEQAGPRILDPIRWVTKPVESASLVERSLDPGFNPVDASNRIQHLEHFGRCASVEGALEGTERRRDRRREVRARREHDAKGEG